jgi:hypothetical protein
MQINRSDAVCAEAEAAPGGLAVVWIQGRGAPVRPAWACLRLSSVV